jgi:hypothetical protein
MNTFLGGIFGTSKPKTLTALTKKNQTNVNKAVYWGFRYNELNDLRDDADGQGDDKLYKKYDRMASDAFNKHLDYMSELPKREQVRVEKFVFTF